MSKIYLYIFFAHIWVFLIVGILVDRTRLNKVEITSSSTYSYVAQPEKPVANRMFLGDHAYVDRRCMPILGMHWGWGAYIVCIWDDAKI